jgi:succinate dehydrogenase / fumarate reductase cytochrome b subunit
MGLTDRQYFTLRRLHSLTGIVPVGVFLLEHFFTNSFALFGAESYNEKVEFLRSLPYLLLIEIFFIFIPIAFHAVLGLWIWWEARFNNRTLGYGRNHLFAAQRITGLFLVFFITYHVLTTRFGHWFGYDNTDLFALMEYKFTHAWEVIFYALGVIAASFHLGNGLFGFGIHWGLATSRRGHLRLAWTGAVVSIAVALVGLNSLLAFQPLGLKPVKLFDYNLEHKALEHEVPEGAFEGADAPSPGESP